MATYLLAPLYVLWSEARHCYYCDAITHSICAHDKVSVLDAVSDCEHDKSAEEGISCFVLYPCLSTPPHSKGMYMPLKKYIN